MSAKPPRSNAFDEADPALQPLVEELNIRLKDGFYPTTEQGLAALVSKPDTPPRPTRWYQLYSELPLDPWGNGYVYRSPGTKHPEGYDLFSSGPDHKPDTKDDDWGH